MGRRGPKPEPAAIKAAKGNPGRRPLGADPVLEAGSAAAAEPEIISPADGVSAQQAEKAAPAGVMPPTWLKGEGLGIWERLAPRLVAMKLLSPIDAEAFGRYCRNYGRWVKMQDVLDLEGEVYESESQHGKLKRANPAFLIADRLERQMLASEDRFGLNPAERQRLYAARAATPAGDLFTGFGVDKTAANKPAGTRPSLLAPRSGPDSPVGFLN